MQIREKTTTEGLNSLLSEQFMIHDQSNPEKMIVSPNGSAESIIAFGMEQKLDLDQQTAFEIMTATFVLTYMSDLTELDASLIEKATKLKDLSQENHRSGKPLRLFLTGPAGSGKCKS